MKAVWYTKNGEAADVLTFGELATPAPGPGEVRVKLATTGVNPSDVKSRRARPLGAPEIIPHSDGAGVIDAVGDGVGRERIGQRVWIWNGQWQRPWGTAAQYIALPAAQAVALPEHVDFAAGACFGIPALTAIEAVRLAGDLKGKTVLVTGASSAVGHYIVQLAVLDGARVIGTVGSPAKAAHARDAGAAETILYKSEPVAERVKALTGGQGADVIIDMDFSTTTAYLNDGALKAHGTLVGYGSNLPGENPVNFRTLLWKSLTLRFLLVYDLHAAGRAFGLKRLDDLLQARALKHAIGARYPMAQMVAAHQAVEQGQLVGNVVVDI